MGGWYIRSIHMHIHTNPVEQQADEDPLKESGRSPQRKSKKVMAAKGVLCFVLVSALATLATSLPQGRCSHDHNDFSRPGLLEPECSFLEPDCHDHDHAGRGASLNARACVEIQAYSPEHIVEHPICCLRPNFEDNALAQGGRRNFRATRAACCELWKGKTSGVDALKNIGCRFSK